MTILFLLLLACRGAEEAPDKQPAPKPSQPPTDPPEPDTDLPHDSGWNDDSGTEDPYLTWTYADVGYVLSCGLVSDGTARCWGWNECGPNWPGPLDQLTQVSVGGGVGCGLRPDGTVWCWRCGLFGENLVREVPPGNFVRVEAGDGAACAQDAAGVLTCWGDDVVVGEPPLGPVLDFALDINAAAAVLPDGSIVAWGDGPLWGDGAPPAGVVFTDISIGRRHACGLDATGLAWCWGDTTMLTPWPDPPLGTWAQIETFNDATCVIDAAGTVVCTYGFESVSFSLWESQRPAVPFLQVGLGEWDGCGVTPLGEAFCWGGDPNEEPYLDVPLLNQP